jgi:hypothetical protein
MVAPEYQLSHVPFSNALLPISSPREFLESHDYSNLGGMLVRATEHMVEKEKKNI